MNILYMAYRYIKVLFKTKFTTLSVAHLKQRRKKNKLAIIGCGPSINNLPDDFFSHLADYDIAAYSYAALLPINITYYLYELPEGDLLTHHECFLYPELCKKYKRGQINNFILKNPHIKGGSLKEHFPDFVSSMTFPIQVTAKKRIKLFLKLISGLGLAKSYFFQVRASLFSTCYWGDALGYDEILLIGIDLNSPEYFYEKPSKWLDQPIPNPLFHVKESFDVHPTNDDSLGVRVEDGLTLLAGHIEAKIKVQSQNSLLAKYFPVKNLVGE